jgi:hypothetical protein
MYATAMVVAHLLVNIVHGLAHGELRVGLAPVASIFVIVVVLVFPLIAMGLLWTVKKRLGGILLSLSMFWLLAQITSTRSFRVDGAPRLS